MVVNKKVGRMDYPVLFAATTIFLIVVSDLVISFMEGLVLLSMLVLYNILLVRNSRTQTKKLNQVVKITRNQFYISLVLIIIGIVGLKFGSEYFLDGAISIASTLGMSDHLIGVTIVAFGTSVPELATSAIAAFRKHDDISIGNLIGSNVFNIHGVLGVTAMVSQIYVSESILSFDFLWMFGFVVALVPAIYWKQRFNRYDGVVFLIGYLAYIYYSFLTL
jgi:cation:H+ antiporter